MFSHLDRPAEAMFEHASTLYIHTLNLLLHPKCLVKHCLRVCISSILCLFFLVKTTTLLRLRTEEYQMSEVEFYCSRFKLSPVPSYGGQHYSVTKHLFRQGRNRGTTLILITFYIRQYAIICFAPQTRDRWLVSAILYWESESTIICVYVTIVDMMLEANCCGENELNILRHIMRVYLVVSNGGKVSSQFLYGIIFNFMTSIVPAKCHV